MKKKKRALTQPTQIQTSSWCGQLEGYANGYLYGWAINTRHTDQRVSLEVCLNQDSVGLVSANLLHQKLTKPGAIDLPIGFEKIDPCHGFVAEVGRLHPGISYSMRIANTQIYLPGSVEAKDEADEAELTPLSLLSSVYSTGDLRLHGYALPMAGGGAYETLYAYCQGEQVSQTTANRRLPALRGHFSDGFGFEINLPLKLADGAQHQITIKTASGYEVNGSPLDVCCLRQGLQNILADEKQSAYQKLAATYETYLPRSLAWSDYASWAKYFSISEHPLHNLSSLSLTVVFDTSHKSDDIVKSRESLFSLARVSGVQLNEIEITQDQSARLAQLKHVLSTQPSGYTLFLQAGMRLHVENIWALICSAEVSDARLIYGDAELAGQAWFKPAWNLEYALASDSLLHTALCQNTALMSSLGAHLAEFEPALWLWNFALQLDQCEPAAIAHYPYVISLSPAIKVHQAQSALTPQLNALLKHYQYDAQLTELVLADLAKQSHLRRLQRFITPTVKALKVCLIIPTRDQCDLLQRCISSIQSFSNWPKLEIIVVDNGSVKAETLAYFKELKAAGIRVIASPGPFNYSYLNNLAVAHTSADILGLLNNDIEARHHGWLDEMMSHFSDERVAMVGAKLSWPNGMVQHGGVVLGPGGLAAHYGNLLHEDDTGHFGRNQVTQQMSAVTAACLLVRKSDWLLAKGLNQIDFPVAFNDVDLCLKLRAKDRRIIWTPFAKLWHLESASRGKEDSPQKQARAQREMANLRRRWGPSLLADSSYHPSLNLDSHSQVFTGYALPPRSRTLRSAGLINVPELTRHELDAES